MITEIVTFALPAGTTREQAMARYRSTAPKWAANPDLLHKYYFFDAEGCRGGGVYVWKSREAAARAHGAEFRRTIAQVYGSEPEIRVLDTVVEVDNVGGAIVEHTAG